MNEGADIDDIRSLYARLMAAEAGRDDPRFERAFETVPREAFLPPGPWQIVRGRRHVETPSANPAHLYQNLLVAIDVPRGINNGEPFLHAAWLGAANPQPGEVVCHIGTGTGYYTALLSMLTIPGGRVHGFEVEADLAERARDNLQPFDGVSVTTGDATRLPLPSSDLIYVNAGVVAPPVAWLEALTDKGRMIFPWRPSADAGLAVVLGRTGSKGFSVRPLMRSWFIPCIGASDTDASLRTPTRQEAGSARSAWLTADREPDESAVAIYRDLWFSAMPIP